MCQKTAAGVMLKRHGSLESVVHRKVQAAFGGEGLVFQSNQDPASYPTSHDRGQCSIHGEREQGCENVRDCAVEAANRQGRSSQGRRASQAWRAGCGESCTSGVRREAL